LAHKAISLKPEEQKLTTNDIGTGKTMLFRMGLTTTVEMMEDGSQWVTIEALEDDGKTKDVLKKTYRVAADKNAQLAEK